MTLFQTPKSSPTFATDGAALRGLGASVGVLVFYWLGMTLASHLPLDFTRPRGLDKVLHFAAFGGLAFLGARLCQRSEWRWWRLGAIFIGIGIYASIDEWSQNWIPLRVCDIQDWLADIGGTGAGLLACVFARRRT